MKILFLSRWFPDPPDNGAKIRISNLLRTLAARHVVTLLAFDDAGSREAETPAELRRICWRVRAIRYRPFRPSSGRALVGLLSPRPRFLVDTDSAEMWAAIAEERGRTRFDLAVASQLDMVPYAVGLRGIPTLLEELELAVFRDRAIGRASLPGRLRARAAWLKLGAYLRQTLPRFAACTVASELERTILRSAAPRYQNVEVIPNAVDVQHYRECSVEPRPASLVYCGALSYGANFDAVRHFLASSYPIVLRAMPETTLRVTGRLAGVDISSLPRLPGLEFTGYLPDVRPVVAGSWVSVVPLRVGGGTRLKILESMALGTPVVSTSKGAEGLDAVDGEHILIADEPAAFAAKVVAVLRSADLRARLAEGGRRLVAERYDWRVVGERFGRLVEEAAARAA